MLQISKCNKTYINGKILKCRFQNCLCCFVYLMISGCFCELKAIHNVKTRRGRFSAIFAWRYT